MRSLAPWTEDPEDHRPGSGPVPPPQAVLTTLCGGALTEAPGLRSYAVVLTVRGAAGAGPAVSGAPAHGPYVHAPTDVRMAGRGDSRPRP
jgi:hypothetical protein